MELTRLKDLLRGISKAQLEKEEETLAWVLAPKKIKTICNLTIRNLSQILTMCRLKIKLKNLYSKKMNLFQSVKEIKAPYVIPLPLDHIKNRTARFPQEQINWLAILRIHLLKMPVAIIFLIIHLILEFKSTE